MKVSYTYSSLDPAARKIEVAKFRARKTNFLVVTDLAARGIDIPTLDHVINYNFPGKSKLFIHRVGRVARAGRSGWAHSLVAPEEMPYVLDLHLFLGKSLKLYQGGKNEENVMGTVPQTVIDEWDQSVRRWNEKTDIVCE